MARKIITCTACKARFDVASYPPGSRVRCGRCSQVLTVPMDSPTTGSAAKKSVSPLASNSGVSARADTGIAPSPKESIAGQSVARLTSPSGAGRPPGRDPLLGSVIHEQYKIIRKLGEGGYGAVYEAEDVNLERRMAIKVMLRSRAKNREYVAKFMREARTAAQLAHPNVVGVHGVGFDKKNDIHFLAMEYVKGRTIHDILQERGVMDLDDAVEYMIQACRGLGAAHERNIIHRDIKPGNLMVTPNGIVKIADFGLAKVYDPDGAQSTVIGTPYFMPPEQFEGKAKDGRTDIYALGVTFYYMLTLKRPHTGNGPAQILLSVMTKEPKSVCDHRPDLPDGIWPIVHRMIHRDVEQRYQRCGDIVRDLEALRGGVEEEDEPIYCPGCGVPNPTDAEECAKCGESLLETCPVCGVEDLAGTLFCGDCGSNIPEERAVGALVEESRSLMIDGSLDAAEQRLAQAEQRSPDNLKVSQARSDLQERREEWSRRRDGVRDLLGQGRAPDAKAMLAEVQQDFAEMAELDLLEADVRTALAAQDPAAAADLEAQEKARGLEDEGRIREALVAWRGVLVLSPFDEEAKAGEKRLASRVDKAEALFREATERLSAGDPEGAVESLLEANTVLPGDALIEGRMDEARRAAQELQAELDSLLAPTTDDMSGSATVARLLSLKGRYPGSTSVAQALTEAERAGRHASAVAVQERLARAVASGREADQAQHPRDAVAAWREACSLDPTNSEAAESLTRAERALAEFDALLRQSRTLLQSGDPAGALERAEQALRLVNDDPLAEAQAARSRTDLETLTHEANRIRNAIASEADDEVMQWAQELAARYSGSSLANAVLAETEAAFREAADKETEERAQQLLARAVKLEQEGNVRAANKTFEEAVGLFPENDDANAGRDRTGARIDMAGQLAATAVERLAAGDPEGAEEAAQESLELLPDQREAAATLGEARAAVSEIERAFRGVRESPTPAEAEGQIERAKALVARFHMSPRCLELLMRCQEVAESSRDAANAAAVESGIADARHALETNRLADAEVAARRVLAIRGDHAAALEVIASVSSRRAQAESHVTDGTSALARGAAEEALRCFEVALAEDPASTAAHDGAARARSTIQSAQARLDDAVAAARAAGSARESVAAWEAVLAIDPAHGLAKNEIESLGSRIRAAETTLADGLRRLESGDPESAAPMLRTAADVLSDDEVGVPLAKAEAGVEDIHESLPVIKAELDKAEGDLDGIATRARALADRYPGADAVRRLADQAERAARDRRRGLAVAAVRVLMKDKRYGEAVSLAQKYRAEGIDTPELTAAENQARDAAGALGELRDKLQAARAEGRLEEAREACNKILHSLPDDLDTRALLTEIEETLREMSARRDEADLLRRRGDVTQALSLYRELLDLEPASVETKRLVDQLEVEATERTQLVTDAQVCLVAGDTPTARKHAQTLLDRYPEDVDARSLHAAASGLESAIAGLLDRARRAKDAGDTDTTTALTDIVLRIAPHHGGARSLRE